ncbi:MAG: hypothetical protein PHE78_03425 [Candidatus Gastranaerophilales bacterium]|nr:hypothetical protein [Candidatus Gastranaerophilales bacterium]
MDVTSLNNKNNTNAVSSGKDSPKSYTYLPPQEPDKFVKSDAEKTQENGNKGKLLAAGAIIGAAVTALVTKGKSSKLSKEVDKFKGESITYKTAYNELVANGYRTDLRDQIETLTKEKEELLRNKKLSEAKTKELQETIGQIPDEVIESASKDAKLQYQTM